MLSLNDVLSNALGEMIAEIVGTSPAEWARERAIRRKLAQAVRDAERQFAVEYAAVDAELTQVLVKQTRFADLPSVREALHAMLARPFNPSPAGASTLRRSFADVLPSYADRARVDRAVGAFLSMLGREVLYIPELQARYALAFDKLSAESSLATAEHTAATARALAAVAASMQSLRDELRLALPAPAALLAAPIPAERTRPWHNLPQRSHTAFIGRQAEREQLRRLLLPHPRSRHFVVTVDGIGGVGKSTLALELAHSYREQYAELPADERFEALIWVSAKRTLLTAGGIQQRRQSFTTLDDLFRELALVLEQPAIMQAAAEERRGMVEHALAARRTLLIVDNLETVDDEELLSFLRELPDPTKAIVTTRHRIDIAYAIRLTGMPRDDALRLMEVEVAAKGVALDPAGMDELERRTGGVPLAIQWSIGLMSLGHSPEAVLRRLSQGQNDIARFCFEESTARLRGRDPHRLLLALALFERSVSRTMLGEVAGLADDPIGRDEGLAELLRLSLVNQKQDRFKLLPLTHAFARAELERHPALEPPLREAWIARLLALAAPYQTLHHLQPSAAELLREGQHLEHLALWGEQAQRLDVVLAVLPALLVHLDVSGRWGDLLRMARQGAEYATLLGDETHLPLLYVSIARIVGQQGQHDEAVRAILLAFEAAEAQGAIDWQVDALGRHAQITRRAGDLARAETLLAQAQALTEQLPAQAAFYARADLEFERGKIARDRGDYEQARQIFTEAQRIFPLDEEGSPFNPERAWGIAGNLGFVLQQLGELDEAAALFERSLAYFRLLGGGYLATLLARTAALALQRGQPEQARELAREALEVSSQLGMVEERAVAERLISSLRAES